MLRDIRIVGDNASTHGALRVDSVKGESSKRVDEHRLDIDESAEMFQKLEMCTPRPPRKSRGSTLEANLAALYRKSASAEVVH